MKCTDNCPYYYQTEVDDFPCCHYGYDDGYAPCEYEEPEEIDWEDYM